MSTTRHRRESPPHTPTGRWAVSDEIDTSANRYEWERVIRRVRLGAPVKAVALTMATYANTDGTGIFPGVARLAAVTEFSERSVRDSLGKLREIGLIRRVREGSRNGRRALADEHELAIPVDLLDRVELLNPDETPAGRAGDRSGTPAPGSGSPAGGAPHQVLTNHPPTQLPTDGSSYVTQVQTAREDEREQAMSLNGRGGW